MKKIMRWQVIEEQRKEKMKKLLFEEQEKIDERDREMPTTKSYNRVINNKFLTRMKIAFMSQLSNS